MFLVVATMLFPQITQSRRNSCNGPHRIYLGQDIPQNKIRNIHVYYHIGK